MVIGTQGHAIHFDDSGSVSLSDPLGLKSFVLRAKGFVVHIQRLGHQINQRDLAGNLFNPSSQFPLPKRGLRLLKASQTCTVYILASDLQAPR